MLSPTLPSSARLGINRCNLPAVILGSLTFQRHPTPLIIDGVRELYADLFRRLEREPTASGRAQVFVDYLVVHFRLDQLGDAGLSPGQGRPRGKADYRRMVRGWAFDADGREGAVMKGWVESRFGLVPRWHGGPIRSPDDAPYTDYQTSRAAGLYNTNALEAQLDLLYAYSQFELAHREPKRDHLRLFRGVNRLEQHERLRQEGAEQWLVLNNLSSFTDTAERAGEFGDHVIEAMVPRAKVFFYNRLLPHLLEAEGEYAVIGGVYAVRRI